jgi:ABC-type nitrate/sulfonate/bicarbonate transport system substrate-binding protein
MTNDGRVFRLLLLAGLFGFSTPLAADTLRVGVISESATNWPLRVAEEKGFFREQDLDVQVTVQVDSAKLLAGLAQGTFDVTHQAADHFVSGVQDGKDVFIFMTIARPVYDFVVRPEIGTIAELRGKTIAVDRPTTGYWLLFSKIFAQNGLPPAAYDLLPNMGGAEKRWQAVQENRAQGTFLNPPLNLKAASGGLRRLTSISDHIKDIPGTAGGAKREWARQHEATLLAYLSAYMRAVDWTLDRKNRDEILAIAAKRGKADRRELEGSYDTFVQNGLVRSAELSMSGIQRVLDLLVESGQLPPAETRPEKYADPSYQQKAMAKAR